MSNVDDWLAREKSHTNKALENASRQFDENDALDVNYLEAIYGAESGFGSDRRAHGANGAAGDFMLDKGTAGRYGLQTAHDNDQRFDVDDSSNAAASYLK